MNCALWLNKQKVQHASKIHENLDVASLRGYFLAGSLLDWLRENGGEDYAEKLSKVSADDPELNQKLANIFGGKPLKAKPMRNVSAEFPTRTPDQISENISSAASSYRYPSSWALGAVNYGSGSSAYLRFSSFGELRELLQNISTSSFGSFNLGSYSQWAWLFALLERGYGSFYLGSFSSFNEWEWEWLFALFGRSYGSFYFGSFSSFNEWEWFFRLFGGSFSMSSFNSFFTQFFSGSFTRSFGGSFGSFNAAEPPNFPVLDEYDRIMFETLMRCPLDRFGYGVHNI